MNSKIQTAAKKCRKAFAAFPNAKLAWCCHHKVLIEPLTEPAENRIKFILKHKSVSEQAIRLDNFRPVRQENVVAPLYAEYQKQRDPLDAEYQKQRAPLDAEYQKQCDTLDAEYQKQCDTLAKPLLREYKKDVPLGTWNGKSIFRKD